MSELIKLPNPNLRQRSKRVGYITDEIQNIIKNMQKATIDWEESREHEVGVALAAVQIDELYRIVIIREDFEKKSNKNFVVLINPEITKYEGEIDVDYEGCLSVQKYYGLVPRHTKVRVKALDLNGKPISFKAEGFLARVIQHEIDHTNGIVYVDKVENEDNYAELLDDGKLKQISYQEVEKSGIFR